MEQAGVWLVTWGGRMEISHLKSYIPSKCSCLVVTWLLNVLKASTVWMDGCIAYEPGVLRGFTSE